MYGRISKWLAGVVLAGGLLAAGAMAQAQRLDPMLNQPADPAYGGAPPDTSGALVATGAAAEDGGSLEKRVAELEKALKKFKDKEDTDKKKAADKMSMQVTGRIFADSVFFGQGAPSIATLGDAQDTTFFRQARIALEGKGFDVVGYKIEMDFVGRTDITTSSALAGADAHTHTVGGVGQTAFKDVYLNVTDLPWLGKVQVGHYKEPFSLEQLTSLKYTTFMERSLADIFTPARNVGVCAFLVAENEMATLAFGGFRAMGDTPPYLASDEEGYAFTTRATWLPWYDEATAGRGLLHLGLGYSFRDVSDPTQRIAQRPEVGAGPNVVDTRIGSVNTLTDVEHYQLLGPELALVYGPFSFQTEYFAAFYDRTGGHASPTFQGGYASVAYFLTGENRAYKRSAGCFDRVKPFENFFRVRTCDGDVAMGKGAWEVGYRYSWLDLDDAGIRGGWCRDNTFGVNWYLNPYTRLMFNYVHSFVSPNADRADVDINVFEMRAQIDF